MWIKAIFIKKENIFSLFSFTVACHYITTDSTSIGHGPAGLMGAYSWKSAFVAKRDTGHWIGQVVLRKIIESLFGLLPFMHEPE